MRNSVLAGAILAAATCLVACESGESTEEAATTQPAMGAMNERCPVSGRPVDPDAPMVTYEGHSIGFCCGGCVNPWNEMSDTDKAAFLAKIPGS